MNCALTSCKKRFKSRTVVKDVLSRGQERRGGRVCSARTARGKTTCFYMMVGLIPSDGGSIYLDGQNLNHMPIHRRARMGLAYLPQEASIFRKLTVAENVQAGPRVDEGSTMAPWRRG